MATAEAYDDWDDPGMAFNDEQVESYEPQACAAVRMNWLLGSIPLAVRRAQLGEKAKWWETVAAKQADLVTWYAVVAELPGVDREGLLGVDGVDGADLRKLTVGARDMGDPLDWLAEWSSMVDQEMRGHVTLGRRCATSKKMSGWGKRERSISNKVANALHKEQTTIARLALQLRSRTGTAKEQNDGE